MKRYDKLLLVDKEDTAMAPMAEAIMQHRLLLEDILIESRGLVVLFEEPVNPRTEKILDMKGLITEQQHTSRQLEESDFDERTLILTMQQAQKDKIMAEYRDPLNVFTLREYVGADEDPADPYGGDLEEYETCFEQLWFMTNRLADILISDAEVPRFQP